jgi:hypothetical protein
MKAIAIVFAYLVGAFFVVRAIVELVTIDYGDASSYEDDWGGPTLVGVLVVHCLPGVIAATLSCRASATAATSASTSESARCCRLAASDAWTSSARR